MKRGFELRASEIERLTIEGAMSEHASRSRRVTTTADFQRAMREQRTTPRRRNKLRRFSRTAEQCADSIGAVVSCSRMLLAAEKRLASPKCGTALRLPFGSPVESWLPRPSACPRPSPHAVPRVGDASCFDCLARQARSARIPRGTRRLRRHSRTIKRVRSFLLSSAARDPIFDPEARSSCLPALGGAYRVRSFRERLVLFGVAGEELLEDFAECCLGIELRQHGKAS
jgi:hypothetical protein